MKSLISPTPSSTAPRGYPDPLTNIRREISPDGLAILTFDHPDTSANVFDEATLDELNDHLAEIEALEVRGLILQSAKPAIFVAGADIGALHTLPKAGLNSLIHKGQALFERLANLKVPTVAAIHGACMGGGLEVALACDWRVASPDKVTNLGLPETQLGILPAWGGCTRLPKLIGLPKALSLILPGKQLAATHALKLGLVDAVVPREQLLAEARVLIERGKRAPESHFKTNNRLTADGLKLFLSRKLRKQTRGNYPAVLEALRVVTASVSVSTEASLENEREAVLLLAETEACRNLIRVFNLQQRSRKLVFDPSADAKPEKIENTAVIGAGVMGAGIAQWISSRGIPVTLRDIDENRVAAGLSSIRKLYAGGVRRRLFDLREATRMMDLIHATAKPVPLMNADLVIEAAVENLDIKKKIFADLSGRTRPDAILATNTSALPIGDLAEAPGIVNPERILGLHFFNPVHRMKLVEIVVTKRTSAAAVESALKFVKSIGKLPVVVNDSPGFLVNRILMPYLLAAAKLYDRGVDARLIDKAMLDFGMPMGPIRLLDEIGIDVALHVAKTMSEAFADRLTVPGIINRMVDSGEFGRKGGSGFYRHAKNGKTELSQAALNVRGLEKPIKMTALEIADLLPMLMVDEAARCLEEGVVSDPQDVDFAMIMGTGWAPFRGGPLRFADSLGAEQLLGRFEAATRAADEKFTPSARLAALAKTNDLFYKS